MTLRELAAEGETALRAGPHPERARLDAERLLLHALERSRAWLVTNWPENASLELHAQFGELIRLRRAGEPMQYITGEAEFYGLPFAVSPDVLIPRPETEHLVEEVLRLAALFSDNPLRIADVGTGSGAIAVALAHALPHARITATDLSSQAIEMARQNARRNHVEERIEFLEGDLLEPLAGRTFSIVASNPPYLLLSDLDSLAVEVREYEPHTALFAGADGLGIYRRLIPGAQELLAHEGWLVMEIGYGQQPLIEQLMLASGYSEVHFVPDYQGIPRVACGRRG